jgi:cell division protein FtsL
MSLQDQMLAREWQRLQIEQEEKAEKVRRAAKNRLSLEDSENLFSDRRSSFPGMGRFGPQ